LDRHFLDARRRASGSHDKRAIFYNFGIEMEEVSPTITADCLDSEAH